MRHDVFRIDVALRIGTRERVLMGFHSAVINVDRRTAVGEVELVVRGMRQYRRIAVEQDPDTLVQVRIATRYGSSPVVIVKTPRPEGRRGRRQSLVPEVLIGDVLGLGSAISNLY